MKSYRVTCLFQPDWVNLIPALFGTNQPDSSQVSAGVAIFNFSYPVTPNNLGPLVIIEESLQPFLFE
jgi:hypothetical protein